MSVDSDDSSQAEVDGGGEEGGTNGEANEVDDEVVVVEVILPEHHPSYVADDFKGSAAYDGDEVAPCAVSDCKADVYQQTKCENGEVCYIARKGRSVLDLAELIERASGVIAKRRLLPVDGVRGWKRNSHG